ncbi:leucine-rich repeat and calponin homology domain-containing protein isoform X2 [Teleopsis dalmanni]|uniref:leucine-rich repeat and calponin homology domain-containing protein isoform X2 n=1 Tax=Teleopsis dalmanni TaxID=139649 RepID=UPI0018CCF295|nr:leucine-rich repeat and calponin homology domain-containing protein isoform X2 [Teleopsis dalmanni]
MAATAAVYNRLHNSSLGGGMGHHSQLARSLERILEEAHLSGELILTNRKLKDFPKTGTKFSLADTVIADLSRNRFCELPEEITTFSFLETLLLYHNSIRSIPESVKHLTSLTYLDLRSNQLSVLPREICFLPLHVLLVSNNRLTSLPDELGRMERLTDLDASYNQLSALPARIGELYSLRSFSLRCNQLMYLPRELTCLTLVSLDVSNNRIASLPLEIRQMLTLVEFNLENNPLTSPPASLCVRGLVHVFKFLDTQAAKEEKGSRAGGNYDGYTTLRRVPRHNSSGNVLEINRVPRHQVDSGYSTCDGIDKRWSHDLPSAKTKSTLSPARKTPTTSPLSLSAELLDVSSTSSTSTIVDESITVSLSAAMVKSLNAELHGDTSPFKRLEEQNVQHSPIILHQHINYAHSSSSNGSSPEQEELMLNQQQSQNTQNAKSDEKSSTSLGNIQTYREYKEALKQQRNQDISRVYNVKGQKTLYDMSEATNALNSNNVTQSEELDVRCNGSVHNTQIMPKSIMKNGTNSNNCTNMTNGINGTLNGIGDDSLVIPKKPIQKVIPSRNTEIMSSQAAKLNDLDKSFSHTNGDYIGYVKPNSPMKIPNSSNNVGGNGGGILTNNNKFNAVGTIKSPVSSTTKLGTTKTHRTVTWNHDIPPEKLSFTMRREFDRQREETELMTQLRSIIETRLKMTLPEDIASALTDGVILCHLANYVRPRSVASIHVPSPGVSKLTMARCRRNVDNFLEACRKIGVDENLICCAADVLEGKGAVQVAITVGELFRLHGTNVGNLVQHNTTKSPTKATRTILSPSPLV